MTDPILETVDDLKLVRGRRRTSPTRRPSLKRSASCPATLDHIRPAAPLALVQTALGLKFANLAVAPRPTVLSPAMRRVFSNEHFGVQWMSESKGLGCMAVRNLERGDDVLFERPLFCTKDGVETFEKVAALDGEEREILRSLALSPRWSGKNPVLARIMTNGFRTPLGIGIFPIAARFNHACEPVSNVVYHYDDHHGLLILTATRKIRAGEELTIAYTSDPILLPAHWGFVCQCGGPCRDRLREMEAYTPPDPSDCW